MNLVNNLKTATLLGALMGLCLLVGHLLGGLQGLLIGLLFGGVGNLFAYFYSDKIALAAMKAREIQRGDLPWLHDMVARLAERASLPMPRLYVCPQPAPNAFATGRNPQHAAVAITEGMLRNFPPQEIEGVLAHELAHVRHRDILTATIAATLAGIISYAGYMLLFFGGGRGRDNPLGMVGVILMVVLAPIAAALIQAMISRSREYAADSYGGKLCGDPHKLAQALRRLEAGNQRTRTDTAPAFHSLYIMKPLSASGLASLFSTHPPTEKRIEALEELARQS